MAPLDLKPYLDAANAASDEVTRIMNEMNAAFTAGTDEGKKTALALRPQLDEAKAKAEEADKLYRSMRNASITNGDAAPKFTPAHVAPVSGESKETPKTMQRAEFDALDHPARHAFIKAGGTVAG